MKNFSCTLLSSCMGACELNWEKTDWQEKTYIFTRGSSQLWSKDSLRIGGLCAILIEEGEAGIGS